MQEKKRGWRILVFSGVALILIVCALFSLVSAHPSFGAQGADFLRNILGDRVVASLELVLFQIQDQVNHAKYALGWSPPTSPWGDNPALPSPGLVTTRTLNSSPVILSIPSMQPGGPAPERSPSASPFTSTPQRLSTAILSPIISPTPSSPPTITPTREPLFPPAALSPLGSRPARAFGVSIYSIQPARLLPTGPTCNRIQSDLTPS